MIQVYKKMQNLGFQPAFQGPIDIQLMKSHEIITNEDLLNKILYEKLIACKLE